ncbi:GPW/gp25 family protein [Chitinophaga japonensis]|uniref:IraD/Gp25-like domain-containing protein n=1 Tax=Chitinophaga japonensis TaxID=104662 RepID=A0A562T0M8_CHIJA|nr:GPW/gp25 family protein [Chitinophaga japonensis]TWI87022.1 hypothetical protein LX66_4290 [Chitinophaga japonensis]
MATDNTFLGRGWSFPPVFDRQQKTVQMLDGEENIRSSIEVVLSTELGERVMLPGFGWRKEGWLFESMTTTAATAIEKEIETALLFFEPRIDLNEVRLLPAQGETGKVEIHIDYTVRSTNTRNNLVYPFYLTEK